MNSNTTSKRGNAMLSAAAVCPNTAVLPTRNDDILANHQWFGYVLPGSEKAEPGVATT